MAHLNKTKKTQEPCELKNLLDQGLIKAQVQIFFYSRGLQAWA